MNNNDSEVLILENELNQDPSNKELLFKIVISYWNNCDFKKAEEKIVRLLRLEPSNAEILNIYGLILQKLEKFSEAVEKFNKAIKLNSGNIDYYNNLAIVYIVSGSNDKAEEVFRKASEFDKSGTILLNWALFNHRQNNYESAMELYEKALKLAPEKIDIYTNYTLLLITIEDFQKANVISETALKKFGENYELLLNAAHINEKLNHFDIAINFYQNALKYSNSPQEIYFNIGYNYQLLSNWEKSELSYLKALEIKPDFEKAKKNLAPIYHRLNKYQEAILIYQELLKSDQDNVDLLMNYAVTLVETEQFDEAETIYDRALDLDKNNPLLHLNKAMLLFYVKRYNEAWEEYEWRLISQNLSPNINKKWKGQGLKGKKVLVREEQGIGDLLQFSRYIPLLKESGAYVILECRNRLKLFFDEKFKIDVFISSEERENTEYDYEIFIANLPKIFNPFFDQSHFSDKYLSIDANLIEKFKPMVRSENKLKVGLVWKGTPLHSFDFKRSMKFNTIKNLLENEHIDFYFLQLDSDLEDEREDVFNSRVINLNEHCSSFMDTAAIIANLDLVITVDTVFGHLAAAQGIPVWLLLSKIPDWRWGIEGENTNWYNSMKIYRQRENGNWKELIKRVDSDLKKILDGNNIDHMLSKAFEQSKEKKIKEAVDTYKKVLELDPDNYEAFFRLGYLSQVAGDYKSAFGYYCSALNIKSDEVNLYNNMGIALKELRNFNDAEKIFELSLQEIPDNLALLNNLAITKFLLGKLDECEDLLNKALKLDKNSVETYMNLSILYDSQKDYKNVLKSLIKAIELNYDNPEAHFNLGVALLKVGKFEQGWEEYEWRKKLKKYIKRNFTKPELDNLNVNNKTIFVYDEQGYGDTINFARYLILLKNKGAKIIFECHSLLYDLFKSCDYLDEVFARKSLELPVLEYDYQISLLSLPRLFKTDFNSIYNEVPYIKTESDTVGKSSNKKIKVGFVWQGRMPLNNLQRACKLENYNELFVLPNIQFYSFQLDAVTENDKNILKDNHIIDFKSKINTFYDTAVLLKEIDIVISIDTAFAHLAGALGKTVWLLLPVSADWRWFIDLSINPWYPTMKIFRQKELGDWKTVFNEVKKELKTISIDLN